MIARYGMPGAVETSTLLAHLVAQVANFGGGKEDGTAYSAGDVLPRMQSKSKILRDAAGNIIPARDPLQARIVAGRGKDKD